MYQVTGNINEEVLQCSINTSVCLMSKYFCPEGIFRPLFSLTENNHVDPSHHTPFPISKSILHKFQTRGRSPKGVDKDVVAGRTHGASERNDKDHFVSWVPGLRVSRNWATISLLSPCCSHFMKMF